MKLHLLNAGKPCPACGQIVRSKRDDNGHLPHSARARIWRFLDQHRDQWFTAAQIHDELLADPEAKFVAQLANVRNAFCALTLYDHVLERERKHDPRFRGPRETSEFMLPTGAKPQGNQTWEALARASE